MTIALVGPPNVGKTALFNRLTGRSAEVGNRPGVTVEALVGRSVFGPATDIADLPGVYSLSPYTEDERAASAYLSGGAVKRCICVADASNPERGIAVALSAAEFRIPAVLAVNMADVLKKHGGRVDIKKLSALLGMPCVAVSSKTGQGVRELYDAALAAPVPERRVPGARADEIFALSGKLARECFNQGTGRGRFTSVFDGLLSNGFFAFFTFSLVVTAVFFTAFGPPGRFLGRAFSSFLNGVNAGAKLVLSRFGLPAFLTGLICDGLLTGLFSILSFLPQLSLLFFSLSLLEESGYLSRTAVLTDSFFRRFGLSGKSAVSLLIGFGCTVPAIMSARSIRSRRERRLLISVLPFVSCGARLPVYLLITTALFPEKTLFVVAFLYLLGISVALITARLSKASDDGDALFFIELPEYRLPDIRSVVKLTLTRVRGFFTRSAGMLSAAFAVFWLLKTYNFDLTPAYNGRFGMLGAIGRAAAFVFVPAGFGFWQACVALLCGFMAKESIVGMLAVITGGTGAALCEELALMFTPASALSFLVFVLLYTPCVSTLRAMTEELKSRRRALFYTLRQLIIAYVISVIVYQAVSLVTLRL